MVMYYYCIWTIEIKRVRYVILLLWVSQRGARTQNIFIIFIGCKNRSIWPIYITRAYKVFKNAIIII